jgi:hypothetical protein
MFEFRDLFQWDRFINPASTDIRTNPDFLGAAQDCRLIEAAWGGHHA